MAARVAAIGTFGPMMNDQDKAIQFRAKPSEGGDIRRQRGAVLVDLAKSENGGAKLDHGSGGEVLLRAA